MRGLIRLAIGGLLLDSQAFRAQRDAENGVQRGLLLVVLIGVLVGIGAVIGNLIERLAAPSNAVIVDTIADGLRAMPWYAEMIESDPTFADQFDQFFTQFIANPFFGGGGILGDLLWIVITPILAVISWLLLSTVVFLGARVLGGKGGFGTTLSTTALVAGVNLLALVQIIPFAQVAGTFLLGLLATYVAIRETHELSPWRAFGAAIFAPLLLLLAGLVIGCFFIVVVGSFAGV